MTKVTKGVFTHIENKVNLLSVISQNALRIPNGHERNDERQVPL
jgi:hypothetical protein